MRFQILRTAKKEFLKTAKIIKTDNAIANITIDNAGRFIVTQNGAVLQTYDLERKEVVERV